MDKTPSRAQQATPLGPPKDEPHLQDRLCAQGELLPGELLQLGLVLDSDLFFLSLRAC